MIEFFSSIGPSDSWVKVNDAFRQKRKAKNSKSGVKIVAKNLKRDIDTLVALETNWTIFMGEKLILKKKLFHRFINLVT